MTSHDKASRHQFIAQGLTSLEMQFFTASNALRAVQPTMNTAQNNSTSNNGNEKDHINSLHCNLSKQNRIAAVSK